MSVLGENGKLIRNMTKSEWYITDAHKKKPVYDILKKDWFFL